MIDLARMTDTTTMVLIDDVTIVVAEEAAATVADLEVEEETLVDGEVAVVEEVTARQATVVLGMTWMRKPTFYLLVDVVVEAEGMEWMRKPTFYLLVGVVVEAEEVVEEDSTRTSASDTTTMRKVVMMSTTREAMTKDGVATTMGTVVGTVVATTPTRLVVVSEEDAAEGVAEEDEVAVVVAATTQLLLGRKVLARRLNLTAPKTEKVEVMRLAILLRWCKHLMVAVVGTDSVEAVVADSDEEAVAAPSLVGLMSLT
jgi:hypothetical protein